ncbi:hypothetical protein [Pseudooceanicola aestuarii]|uniref:hypothetical protein n=1 Tax=Pseudooceanicola aestuarii TaxID=2697319 RepID=UPI0013D20CAD|nr:hypothetical protein [Pseudooceanicola aestuarii]
MADQHYHTDYHTDPKPRSGGSGAIAFVVGGLVVAVGIVLYIVFGNVGGTGDPAPAGDIEINATSDSAAGAGGEGAAADSGAVADSADDGAAASAGAEAGAGAGADTGADETGAAATSGADAQN